MKKRLLNAMNKIESQRKNPPQKIRPISGKTRLAMDVIIQADRELDRQERDEQKAS